MSAPRLPLVVCVDDDEAMLATIVRALKGEQLEVRATLSPSDALGWIATEDVAVMVANPELRAMTGAQLVAHARRLRPETVRILLAGKRAPQPAVENTDLGEIFKVLYKPLSGEQLRITVRSGLEHHRELVELSGDRDRHARREALRSALEAEYPGISTPARTGSGPYVVTADPWADAAVLGLVGLSSALERT